MWEYNYTSELYHYGVKGMRWGHRKARYNDAKKRYRIAEREASRKNHNAFGFKRIQESNKADENAKKAYADMIVEKAKYKKSGSKNPDRAEFKSYVNSMSKSGIPGSAADKKGHSQAVYNRLIKDKGQEYADKVAKKVQNKAVSRIVGSTIVIAGSLAAMQILAGRASSDGGVKLDPNTVFYQGYK